MLLKRLLICTSLVFGSLLADPASTCAQETAVQTGSVETAKEDSPADKRPVHIYFISGGPIDVFGRPATAVIREYAHVQGIKLNVPVTCTRKWCMKWRSVAKEIEKFDSKDKVVLIGHSWGASAAMNIIYQLKKKNRPIELLVTIDSVPLPGSLLKTNKIPENVVENYNYFQSKDVLLQPRLKNRRGKTKDANIHNVLVSMGTVYSPHCQLADKLAPVIAMQVRLVMLGQLDQLKMPNELNAEMLQRAVSMVKNSSTL